MPNYYEILGCEKSASLEELKRSFHEEVKKVHPDKGSIDSQEAFLNLHRAWKTLCDPVKREEYDRELERNDFTNSPMYCEVELKEMIFDTDSETYSYGCRCGGVYVLCKSDINNADEIRVGCDDCTFYIKIKVSDNAKS